MIGEGEHILAPSQLYVDYSQGSLEETGLTLDFAIEGMAFSPFKRLRASSTPRRSGSFSLDGGGLSPCPPMGGFWGADGQPIYLAIDRIPGRSGREPHTEGGGYIGAAGSYALRTTGSWRK